MDIKYLKRFETPENTLKYLEETLNNGPAKFFSGSVKIGSERSIFDKTPSNWPIVMYPIINYFESGNFQEALTLLEQSEKYKEDSRAKTLISSSREKSLGIVKRLKEVDEHQREDRFSQTKMSEKDALEVITGECKQNYEQILSNLNTLKDL